MIQWQIIWIQTTISLVTWNLPTDNLQINHQLWACKGRVDRRSPPEWRKALNFIINQKGQTLAKSCARALTSLLTVLVTWWRSHNRSSASLIRLGQCSTRLRLHTILYWTPLAFPCMKKTILNPHSQEGQVWLINWMKHKILSRQ